MAGQWRLQRPWRLSVAVSLVGLGTLVGCSGHSPHDDDARAEITAVVRAHPDQVVPQSLARLRPTQPASTPAPQPASTVAAGPRSAAGWGWPQTLLLALIAASLSVAVIQTLRTRSLIAAYRAEADRQRATVWSLRKDLQDAQQQLAVHRTDTERAITDAQATLTGKVSDLCRTLNSQDQALRQDLSTLTAQLRLLAQAFRAHQRSPGLTQEHYVAAQSPDQKSLQPRSAPGGQSDPNPSPPSHDTAPPT